MIITFVLLPFFTFSFIRFNTIYYRFYYIIRKFESQFGIFITIYSIYFRCFSFITMYSIYSTSTSCPRIKRGQLVDVVWQPEPTVTHECAGPRAAQIRISVIWCHAWYDFTCVRWLCKLDSESLVDMPPLYIEESSVQQRKNNSSLED